MANRLDLRLPFFHLSSQGFWDPFGAEMRGAKAPESCSVCDISHEFFELLADPGFRLKARMVLITKFFAPNERIALFETLGIQHNESSLAAANDALSEAAEAAKRKGRCARFAVRVCSEYRYTCALTGYRCVTGDGARLSMRRTLRLGQKLRMMILKMDSPCPRALIGCLMRACGLWMITTVFWSIRDVSLNKVQTSCD